jgi:hypothetical protein
MDRKQILLLSEATISGPTSPNGPSTGNGFAPIKIIKSVRHIKKTGTLVILCTRVLLHLYSVLHVV